MRSTTTLAAIVISTFASIAICQTTPPVSDPVPLTAERAVAIAIKHNPSVIAAVMDINAAKSGVRSAQALTNPKFEVSPPLTAHGSENVILLQQPLELNGTRSARTAVASAKLSEKQAEAIIQLQDIVYATKTAYYEMARSQELLSLDRNLLAIAEKFDTSMRREVELGSRPGMDIAQTGLEVIDARRRVTMEEGRLVSFTATLNTLMGRNPDSPCIATLPKPNLKFTPLDQRKLVTQAMISRPEISSELAKEYEFKQVARLTRDQLRPDVSLQFRAGSDFLANTHDAGVGLAINLPMFDYGGGKERIRQSEESAQAEGERLLAAKNLVSAEVIQAVVDMRTAESVVIDFRRSGLGQAKRLLDSVRMGMREGSANILQVLEAERSYASVQTDYINAQADLALAEAELEHATGSFKLKSAPPLLLKMRKQQ